MARILEDAEDRCPSHSKGTSGVILYSNRFPTKQTRTMSREADDWFPVTGLFLLRTPRGEGCTFKCAISSSVRLKSTSSKTDQPHGSTDARLVPPFMALTLRSSLTKDKISDLGQSYLAALFLGFLVGEIRIIM